MSTNWWEFEKEAAGTLTIPNKHTSEPPLPHHHDHDSSQMTEPKIRLDLSSFLKLLDSNNGRDKLSKFIQYSARFIKWELSRFHPERKELMTRFASLEKGTANARKLVRLFRSLSYLQKIHQTVVNKKVLLIEWLFINYFVLLFNPITTNPFSRVKLSSISPLINYLRYWVLLDGQIIFGGIILCGSLVLVSEIFFHFPSSELHSSQFSFVDNNQKECWRLMRNPFRSGLFTVGSLDFFSQSFRTRCSCVRASKEKCSCWKKVLKQLPFEKRDANYIGTMSRICQISVLLHRVQDSLRVSLVHFRFVFKL